MPRIEPAASVPQPSTLNPQPCPWPVLSNGAPNFEKMDVAQRRAYDVHRLTKKFG